MTVATKTMKVRTKKLSRLGSKAHRPYVYPTLIIMTLLIGIPVLALIAVSFTNYMLAMPFSNVEFVGMRNYHRIFFGANPVIIYSLMISFGMAAACMAATLVIGFGSALLLNHNGVRFKGLIIACLIVPIVMTPTIASLTWRLMYNAEFGVFNYLLNRFFGFTVVWLGPDNAMLSIFLYNVWTFTPFVTLILYAGLRSLPMDPYEAALIDGANHIQTFFYVTLPMLKRLILITVMFRGFDLLRIFDAPFVLTGGGPGRMTEFIGLLIFRTGFGVNNQVARSASIAVVLLLICALISIPLIYAMRKRDN